MTRRFRPMIFVALITVVLAATPLMAVDTREVNFSGDIFVDGQEIEKGWYDLQWKKSDDGAVEVRVLKKGKLMATATGRVVQSESKAEVDRVLYRVADGKRSLAEIHTAGSAEVIQIGG